MRVAVKIELSDADRQRLERLSRSRSAAMRLRERSRMVLMAAGGMTNKEIAAKLGTDQNKVGRWRRRFADEGLEGIAKERPRGGNHGGKDSKAQAALRREVIRLTTQTEAPDGTHWSCRSMARAAETTHSFVPPGLALERAEAASGADLQAEHGSALRGEASGRGGAVPRPAGQRGRLQLRREELDRNGSSCTSRPPARRG